MSEEWNSRLALMAIVATCWGARLTYNFSRRGGYTWPLWLGEEDYRWEHVRQGAVSEWLMPSKHPFVYQLFNLTFICLYQHFLLLAIALPVHVAYVAKDKNATLIDHAIGWGFIALLFLEGMADQEQLVYQTEKYRRRALGKNHVTGIYADGFVRHGLWWICRHPNYACEQAMWITFHFFAISVRVQELPAQGWIEIIFDWTIVGSILLVGLFFFSARLSEGISAEKYPKYKFYQQSTWMFFPFGTWNYQGDLEETAALKK